jgi:glyceraldehyde 3-phosphate dehydrogenase
MIPTSTGAAKATALVLPELSGKMDGMAIRVPVPDGSVTDIVAQLEKSTNAQEINACLRTASQQPPLRGILEVNDDEIVSVDVIGNPHSSIVDAPATMVLNGTMAKVLAWYDNEWGYSCRLAELADRLIAS